MNSGDFQRVNSELDSQNGKFFTLKGVIWQSAPIIGYPPCDCRHRCGLAYFFNLAENKRTELYLLRRLAYMSKEPFEANRIIEQRSIESTRIAEDRKLELDRTGRIFSDNYINYLTTDVLKLAEHLQMIVSKVNGRSIDAICISSFGPRL